MSTPSEMRRPLFKRQLPVVTPQTVAQQNLRPYTTLNQPVGERAQLKVAEFSIKAAPVNAVSSSSSALVNLANLGFNDIAGQMRSVENQARLAQSVAEATQAAETEAKLKQSLGELRRSEVAKIDGQISAELAKLGITKSDLQKDSELRQKVTEWKAKLYAQLNADLAENEQKQITSAQESVTSSQLAERKQLESDIGSYEQAASTEVINQDIDFNGAVLEQQNQIMAEAGFKGSWTDFVKYAEQQKATVSSLLSNGVVLQEGNKISVIKPVGDLSDDDISLLNDVGIEITRAQRDTAKNVDLLTNSGVVKINENVITVVKPISELTDEDVTLLGKIGIPVSNSQRSIAKNIDRLSKSGTIKVESDNVSLAKKVGDLSNEELYWLYGLGFKITREQRDEAKNTDLLIDAGVVKVENNLATVVKPVYDLTNDDIGLLNAIGINVTIDQRNTAKIVNVLSRSGTIKIEGDKISLAKNLGDLNNYEVTFLNKIGMDITVAQRDNAKIVDSLTNRGVLKVENNMASLVHPVYSLTDEDLNDLNVIGINITTKDRDTARNIYGLTYLKTIKTEGDKITLNKEVSDLSDTELTLLNKIGMDITKEQRNTALTIKNLQNGGVVKVAESSVSLLKPVSDLSDSELTELNKIGLIVTKDQRDSAALVKSLSERGVLNVSDTSASLAKRVGDLSDGELEDLSKIGIAVTASQRDLAKTVDTLASDNVIAVENDDSATLVKSVGDLSDEEIRKLNSIGITVTASQRDVAQTTQRLLDGGVIQASGNEISIVKNLADLTAADVSQLNSLGFTVSDNDVQNAKAMANVVGTTKFTVAQIAAQNEIFKQAHDAGKISDSQYSLAVAQQNANLAAVQGVMNQLVSKGTIKSSGDNVTLNKPVTSLSDSEIDQLNILGFNISKEQVQQLKTQTNAISSLVSSGVIKTTHNASTPLQKSLVMNVPLASISDSQLEQLKTAGFQISAKDEANRRATIDLVNSGLIKLDGDSISLKKDASALTDAEVAKLAEVGININIPKNPVTYREPVNPLSTSTGMPPGASAQLMKSGAIWGDAINTLLAPVQLVEALIPGVQPLETGLRGPTSSNIKYYANLSPTEQAGVVAGGALLSAMAGYAEFVPVGLAAKAIPSVARGITQQLIKTLPVGVKTEALASSLRSVASNLKISVSQLKIPLTEVSTAQLQRGMAVLLKNPKFQQAIVWGSMAGLNAVDVYTQLASGKPIDEILKQTSVSVASQIGSIKGFQTGLEIGAEKFSKVATLVRLTGGDIKITTNGDIITSYRQMKDVPKQLKELYSLEMDPLEGKVKVIGYISKIDGKTTFQPIIQEMDSSLLSQLIQAKRVGPAAIKTVLVDNLGEKGFRQLVSSLNKNGTKTLLEMSAQEINNVAFKELGMGSLYPKALANFEKEYPYNILGKNVRVEYIAALGKSGSQQIPLEVRQLFTDLKALGFDSTEMAYWESQILTKSPEQIAKQVKTVIENTKTQQDILALSAKYSSENGSGFAQSLKAQGFTDKQVVEAIKITTASMDNPQGFAQAISKLNANGDQLVTILRGVPAENLAPTLQFINLKPLTAIVESVLDSAVETGNLKAAAGFLALIPEDKMSNVLNGLSLAELTQISPLLNQNYLVTVISDPAVKAETKGQIIAGLSTEQIKTALPKMSTAELSLAASTFTVEKANQILPILKSEQIAPVLASLDSKVTAKIDTKTLTNLMDKIPTNQVNGVIPKLDDAVTHKLDPSYLAKIMPSLTPKDFAAILPKLTPEQFDEILPKLSSETLSSIMVKLEITPELLQKYITQQIEMEPIILRLPTPIPPVFLKKMLDHQIDQNKKEMQQKITMFDVHIQGRGSSMRYTIKSGSFQRAAQEALQRYQPRQIPINVTVKKATQQ